MSFEDGVMFIETYTNNRCAELTLGKRITWSTSVATVKTYTDLLASFDRKKENTDWDALKSTALTSSGKLIKLRDKVAFLAGTSRDICTQFCCNKTNRPKTIMDTVRYEIIRLYFIGFYITRWIRQQLKDT